MSLETDVKILHRVPLLASFADDQLRLLAFSAENRRLRKGARLFSAGERADSGYVVVSGSMSLLWPRETGDHEFGRAGPSDLIGAAALIIDGQRPHAAIALEPTELIQIRRVLFKRMLGEYPDAARKVRDFFAAELQQTAQSFMSVHDRLVPPGKTG